MQVHVQVVILFQELFLFKRRMKYINQLANVQDAILFQELFLFERKMKYIDRLALFQVVTLFLDSIYQLQFKHRMMYIDQLALFQDSIPFQVIHDGGDVYFRHFLKIKQGLQKIIFSYYFIIYKNIILILLYFVNFSIF